MENTLSNTQSLQTEILKLLELSSMEEQERVMWNVLVPSMNQEELEKFKTILDKEVNKLSEIYFKALKQSK